MAFLVHLMELEIMIEMDKWNLLYLLVDFLRKNAEIYGFN